MAGSYGYGEEPSGSKNAGNFLISCRNQLAFQEGLCSMEYVNIGLAGSVTRELLGEVYREVSGSGVPRGVWGVQPPSPQFRSFDKAEPNSQFR